MSGESVRSVRCLVVDDSRTVRKVMGRILEELGFSVREAADGAEALAACRSEMPELVLLDWNMPNMDGMAFFREFRTIDGSAAARVVFCTTENEVHRIVEALDAGADEYIMKPFSREIVESKLERLGIL